MHSDNNRVPDSLGMPRAPRLSVSPEGGFGMSFFELDCSRAIVGFAPPVRDNAFIFALQLTRCEDFDLYAEGRLIRPHQFEAGSVAIFDLRTNLSGELRDPFHAVDLYLPVAALNAVAEEWAPARLDELRHTPGRAVADPTLRALLLSMRPALAAPPEQTSRLFVDHVAQAIATHVVHTYGGVSVRRRPSRGGLSPAHVRRVRELLDANLAGRILLGDLAAACQLSTRQFTRAFRQTMGMAPHQWLLQQRVNRSKDLLRHTTQPLSVVAADSGFADQSHFTRVFTRVIGTSPAAWRRLRGK